MTQEDKQLLLKVFCAMLPYGFIVHRYSDNRDLIFKRNELDQFAHFLEYSEGDDFKPYLRPMSSITEEEEDEYWYKINDGENVPKDFEGILTIEQIGTCSYIVLDWLNEHHFDYRGLIEKGLALEAPDGMYKIE